MGTGEFNTGEGQPRDGLLLLLWQCKTPEWQVVVTNTGRLNVACII